MPLRSDKDYREFSSSELPAVVVANVPSTPVSDSESVRREHFSSFSSQQFGAVMRRNQASPTAGSPHAGGQIIASRANTEDPGAVRDSPTSPIKLSSLGLIKEGPGGEMYIVDSNQAHKDE